MGVKLDIFITYVKYSHLIFYIGTLVNFLYLRENFLKRDSPSMYIALVLNLIHMHKRHFVSID